jgi:rRNA-processing protein CGR1
LRLLLSSLFAPFEHGRILYTSTNIFSGKQWHETKKAFRPTAGQTSYAKRQVKDQALAVVKAQEKEMKEEKEAERQVRHDKRRHSRTATDTDIETYHSTQGEARGKRREGTLRETGSQDAPEESRQTEAQREEKQAPEVIDDCPSALGVSEGQEGRWESREDAKRARHTSIERYPGCIFMAFWRGLDLEKGQRMHLQFNNYFQHDLLVVPSTF